MPQMGFEPTIPSGNKRSLSVEWWGLTATAKPERSGALPAHKDRAGLSYAGAAFIALSGAERVQFFAELERLATSWAEFKSSRLIEVKWCQPKLVVEVKHLAGSKLLRHATVRGLVE